jgi:uncharacterized hydrophobic protein (TIGR00271 family)
MNPNEPKQPKDEPGLLRDNLRAIWRFIKITVNIRAGADIEGTVAGIKRDIDFKGPNVWILICSIFIASIGLNVNSAAAIIGAMLISPLMGPILGIGLSIGTTDIDTLKRSLKSLGVAVFISLLTSFLYFSFTPLQEIQSELLARTRPTILDVFIAIFGGTAGIIAGSRKEKTNVIPGVAIATALMPPLCTAGFGLATGNIPFFLGAFYLFFLNSVFICLSTLVVVRYLGIPQVSFVNPQRQQKVKMYLASFVMVTILPSGFIFYQVIDESYFRTRAERFIAENIRFEGSEVINKKVTFTDSTKVIELFLMGEHIDLKRQKEIKAKLPDYGLKNCDLIFFQSKDAGRELEGLSLQLRTGIIEDLYRKNEELIKDKDEKINFLEQQLNKALRDSLPLQNLRREFAIQYPGVQKYAFSYTIELDRTGKRDTMPTFLIEWDAATKRNSRVRLANEKKMKEWLLVRLNLDTLRLVNY